MTDDLLAQLRPLLDKVALVGISYFDRDGQPLQQRLLAGTVVRVTPEDGITLKLLHSDGEFTLPSDISPWFIAPAGRYTESEGGQAVENPDYLVTWDVHRSQAGKDEGEQEWWEWVPRTVPPSVGK